MLHFKSIRTLINGIFSLKQVLTNISLNIFSLFLISFIFTKYSHHCLNSLLRQCAVLCFMSLFSFSLLLLPPPSLHTRVRGPPANKYLLYEEKSEPPASRYLDKVKSTSTIFSLILDSICCHGATERPSRLLVGPAWGYREVGIIYTFL